MDAAIISGSRRFLVQHLVILFQVWKWGLAWIWGTKQRSQSFHKRFHGFKWIWKESHFVRIIVSVRRLTAVKSLCSISTFISCFCRWWLKTINFTFLTAHPWKYYSIYKLERRSYSNWNFDNSRFSNWVVCKERMSLVSCSRNWANFVDITFSASFVDSKYFMCAFCVCSCVKLVLVKRLSSCEKPFTLFKFLKWKVGRWNATDGSLCDPRVSGLPSLTSLYLAVKPVSHCWTKYSAT